MQIDVKIGRIGSEIDTNVIIGLFKGDQLEESDSMIMESALRRYLHGMLKLGDFKGDELEVAVLYPCGQAPPGRVILLGLGARSDFCLETARRVSGIAVKRALKLDVSDLSTAVHGLDVPEFELQDCAQATVEGLLLGEYRYDCHKSAGPERTRLENLTVVIQQRAQVNEVRDGIETARITAAGTALARDLSNAPGNALPPRKLASAARKMAADCDLKCRVLTRKDIKKERMGALIAVNAGSEEPPRFIILEYGTPSEGRDTVVFIGKGITFDSGGISIKPSGGMEEMKHDMSGAAAVIGAMQSIAMLKPPLHVVGLVPATENLPDGKALKPGDIITALSGKTIEVINTDAEGRLVLADALGYAERFSPAAVIDLATLTGACVVALGHAASGMMGNDKPLQERVRKAGETTGERVWPLPIWKDYHDQIKSHIADVKNTGGRWGGALTAGAFLDSFIERPWVHLDIAGTAYTEASKSYCPKGATGVGVRLLVQLVRDWKS